MPVTILQNRLVTPDGKPIVGRRITATLMATPSWVGASTEQGRALGSVVTYTMAPDPAETPNPGGLWQLELIPADEYDDEVERRIWYQVDEGDGMLWAVTFDSTDGPEVWLKDHLIDPPQPQPAHPIISRLGDLHDVAHQPPSEGDALVYRNGAWRPSEIASALASLTDVDGNAVDEAADDAVLVKRGGVWTAMPLNLPALADVDKDSMKDPQTGAVLTYLGPQGWGIKKSAVWLTWRMSPSEADPSGRTVVFEIISSTPDETFVLWWGDEGVDDPGTDISDASAALEHVYADGSYEVWLQYADGSGDPATKTVTIPLTEPVEGTNEL